MKVKITITDSFVDKEIVVDMSESDLEKLHAMLESGYDVGIEYADPM